MNAIYFKHFKDVLITHLKIEPHYAHYLTERVFDLRDQAVSDRHWELILINAQLAATAGLWLEMLCDCDPNEWYLIAGKLNLLPLTDYRDFYDQR